MLVPVVAVSFVGLIGMPAIRLLSSSAKTKDWARTRNAAHSRF
jgi:hypothetical protein